jgi:flavin reductase (DIM6/NTAB) family NADH-FMN oxidoreductase RutF
MKSIDPADLSPIETYNLLVSVVVPRPIALVSTLSAGGVANLAPFSFFMVGGANPPSLMVSPVLGNEQREKDTLANIRATGEFVVNLVNFEMRDGMNQAGRPLDESEWEASGFTSLPSDLVKPCRVQESPVHLECRLHEIVHHGEDTLSARYIIGEIVRFHVTEGGGSAIARLGGPEYLDLGSMTKFELGRPQ